MIKVDFAKLDRAFNPKCIVVIGDKGVSNYRWLRSHMHLPAHVYSVQIDPNEIEGIKALGVTNFTSLQDVPEPVDLAIVAVPRQVTPRILEDLIKKDVAAAHFYTAGFSETHAEPGISLEKRLVERSEQTNFHLIGPNCMGLLNLAQGGLAPGQTQAPPPKEYSNYVEGSVGLLSQSGMHGSTIGREAALQGVKVGKLVSYGNGTVIDSTDFIEYFGQDKDIMAIGLYVEGIKDGKRFLKVVKEVSKKKPVVIWKGGRTEAGAKTIASHTDSMSAPRAVWESAIKQCGAISVNRVEELVDVLQALRFLPEVTGDRVGLTGGSGGQGVAMTDAFSELGLKVPTLTQNSLDQLAGFFTVIGGSYFNPIDTANENRNNMPRILDILAHDANIDNVVLLTGSRAGSGPQADALMNALKDIRQSGKPVVGLMPLSFSMSGGESELVGTAVLRMQKIGIPVFFSFERGAFAVKKALDYYKMRKSLIAG